MFKYIGNYRIHPAAAKWPLSDDLEGLKQDIATRGQRVPIVRWYETDPMNGTRTPWIIDGRNRLQCCIDLGIEPVFFDVDDPDLNPWRESVTYNAHRRDMEAVVKACNVLAIKIEADKFDAIRSEVAARGNAARSEAAKGNRNAASVEDDDHTKQSRATLPSTVSEERDHSEVDARKSRHQLALDAQVGDRSAQKAITLHQEDPELFERVRKGEVKQAKAMHTVKLAKAQRRAAEEVATAEIPQTVTIVCADAVDFVLGLEHQPHCVVMDPPYGIAVHRSRDVLEGGTGQDYADGKEYAESLLHRLCEALAQRLHPSAHLYVFAGSYLEQTWIPMQIMSQFFDVQPWPIIWAKNNHTMSDAAGTYPRKHENILFAKMRGSKRVLAECVGSVIQCASQRQSTHSAEKPTELLRTLIGQSTVPGELVIDPFTGSGSTAVAAVELGRAFIGSEMDENWVNSAKVRVSRAVKL